MAVSIETNWSRQFHHSNHTVNVDGHNITTTVTNDPHVVEQWITETERTHKCRLSMYRQDQLLFQIDHLTSKLQMEIDRFHLYEQRDPDVDHADYQVEYDYDHDSANHQVPKPELIVGLDIEWMPNTNRNQNNPVAVVQLCVDNRCLIFQILHSPAIPNVLYDFLKNTNYTFVGVNVKSDLRKLDHDFFHLGKGARYIDLARLAAFKYDDPNLQFRDLKYLADFMLGIYIEKPLHINMSNWDAPNLTKDQIIYACVDAFLSYEIGKKLKDPSEF